MNLKIASAAVASVAFAALFATAGCAGDPCNKAADRIASCLPASTAPGSTTTTPALSTCAGVPLCDANCVNSATCDEIKTAFAVMPPPDNALTKCFSNCVTAK